MTNAADLTPQEILMTPMDPASNDAGAESIRHYLLRLLGQVWEEGEEFSGKRPFGSSGWQHEIYRALDNAYPDAGFYGEAYPSGWADPRQDVCDTAIRRAIAALRV